MCLEVFLGADCELSEPADWLRVGDRVPRDVKERLQSQNVVEIGAAHTGCGCGFLVEGTNVEVNEVEEEDRRAHAALLSYIARAASEQPAHVIVRWAGDSLKKTRPMALAVADLETLDLSIAWDHPQDIILRPS